MGLADLGAHRERGAGLATRGLVSSALDRRGLSSRPQNGLSHRVAPTAELRRLAPFAGLAGPDGGAAVATAGGRTRWARAAGERDSAHRSGAGGGPVGQGARRLVDRAAVLVHDCPLW